MRVAVVHEWLVNYAGSEKVVEQILKCFPEADLFSVVDFLTDADRQKFGGRRAKTTFIQKLPLARRKYQAYLPLMPLAIEQLDLAGYDVVISSCHAVSKGVVTGPQQLHISYTHTPMRYAWDLQNQYLRESGLDSKPSGLIARWLLHRLRIWDVRASFGVDTYVSNSRFIASRIAKYYRRKAEVIYPPVDTSSFQMQCNKSDYYLTASRLVPYKRVDLIVAAFAVMPDKHLVVIGDGPDMEKIRAMATPNVTVLGYQPFDALRSHMQAARAFVFAAEEDFGITPVEAQACGTPVIAYGRGGALETVVPLGQAAPTGIFFAEQSAAAIEEAIQRFEASSGFLPEDCAANAARFSEENFRARFSELVLQSWQQFRESACPPHSLF